MGHRDVVNATDTSGTTCTSGNVSPVGVNRCLVVLCTSEHGTTGEVPTGITFGGVALTLLDSQIRTTGQASLWYLLDPSLTPATVVATWTNTQAGMGLCCIAYADVDQVTPFDTSVTAEGSSTTPSVTVAHDAGDMVVVGAWQEQAGGTAGTPANIDNEHRDSDVNNDRMFAGDADESAASSTAYSWTTVVNDDWAIVGVALNRAGPASGDPLTASITTPALGTYRVIAAASNSGGTTNKAYAAMGFAYGGVTYDPSVLSHYTQIDRNGMSLYDFGAITIPPTPLPDGATVGTVTLRLHIIMGDLTYASRNVDVDWIMLMPIDFGYVYGDKATGTDVLVIDSISKPPQLGRWDTSDVFQERPVQEGTPPLVDPDGTRIYMLVDDKSTSDYSITDGGEVTVRIIPQYLNIG
jgi:hypothetical protein